MLTKFFIYLLSIPLFTSCTGGSTIKANIDSTAIITPTTSPLPLVEKLTDMEQLTFTGDNRFASISDDNTKIVFASRLRIQHKKFQIYQLSLTQNQEERLTFNDGSAIDPIYADSKLKIYFASSTDEIKDFQDSSTILNYFDIPFTIYDSANRTMNLEIYSLSLADKTNIPLRLTEHPGYDANPQQMSDGSYLWVQKHKKDFLLFKSKVKSKKEIELFKQTDPIWKASWNNSLSLWAWISWSIDNPIQETKIFTFKENSKKPESLLLPEGIYHDVSWVADQSLLMFSVKLKNSKDFDIYLYDLSKQCLTPLVLNPGDDIEPTINKKNSFLVFSHRPPTNNGNYFQLYKKNLTSVQETCIKPLK